LVRPRDRSMRRRRWCVGDAVDRRRKSRSRKNGVPNATIAQAPGFPREVEQLALHERISPSSVPSSRDAALTRKKGSTGDGERTSIVRGRAAAGDRPRGARARQEVRSRKFRARGAGHDQAQIIRLGRLADIGDALQRTRSWTRRRSSRRQLTVMKQPI